VTAVPHEPRTSMDAWRVTAIGEPAQVLARARVPVPTPGPGQALVHVHAAGLNFPDVLMARGHYQERPPLPFTPGLELCGTVVELGDTPGDRDGAGPEPLRVGQRVVGLTTLPHGSLASYALAAVADLFPAPPGLDDATASVLHISYQTGWFGLHRRARLRAGETLLVHAAAGGVGSAAVQLGRAAGARVVAVVGGPAKAAVARELGADLVVDRTTEDVVAVVREATGGRGCDVVYDPVGGAAYTVSAKIVAFEGRIVVVGFAGGTIPAPPLNHALVKNYGILGLHWGLYRQQDPAAIRAAHVEITGLVERGAVRPLLGGTLDVGDVPEGLTRLAAGTVTGRLAVTLPGGPDGPDDGTG